MLSTIVARVLPESSSGMAIRELVSQQTAAYNEAVTRLNRGIFIPKRSSRTNPRGFNKLLTEWRHEEPYRRRIPYSNHAGWEQAWEANERMREESARRLSRIARDYDVPLQVLAILEGIVTVLDAAPGKPDFIRPLFMSIHWYVEYERSATTPAAIRDKLRKYFRVVSRGYDCSVIVICETDRAAEIFRQQHRNLERELGVTFPLITSTYAQVTAGDRFDTCWDLDGRTVTLLEASERAP